MIRILIVDDQNIFRQGIQAWLESRQELEVIGTAEDANSAIERIKIFRPDIVLMDIEMPGMNGIAVTEVVSQQFSQTKVIVLSSYEDREYLTRALQAGAAGYLLKNTSAEDLERAIWSVYRGQSQIESRLLGELLAETSFSPSLKSSKQNGSTSVGKQLLEKTSLKLENNTVNDRYLHSLGENSSHNRSPSKINHNTYKTTQKPILERSESKTKKPSDRNEMYSKVLQQKLQIFSQPKNRWVIILGALGLLAAGTTIAYGLNFANQKTAPVVTKKIEPKLTAITALGRLEPQGEIITLSPSPNLGGAKIGRLLVEEGERVKTGQIIAVLDNHALKKAAVEVAQQEAEVARANLAIVKAGEKTGDIDAKKAIVKKLEAELAGKTKTQEAIIARLEAQLRRETQVQAANVGRLQAELTNATSELQRYQQIAREGAISISELDSRRLTLETAREKVREAQASSQRTTDTLQEEINEARATLEETQNSLDQQIKEARASLASITEVRPIDIQKAQAELDRAVANFNEAKEELELTYVKAPINGQILKINAYPGETVIQDEGIVDLGQTERMMATAEVYESDISKIALGQQVTIVSEGDAFPGQLQGTVTHIRPQIGKKDVLDTDPAADVDVRVVEVKIELNREDSQRVAGLTNAKVIVKIML